MRRSFSVSEGQFKENYENRVDLTRIAIRIIISGKQILHGWETKIYNDVNTETIQPYYAFQTLFQLVTYH